MFDGKVIRNATYYKYITQRKEATFAQFMGTFWNDIKIASIISCPRVTYDDIHVIG
jgi:nitrous oxidase accessory protein NosD